VLEYEKSINGLKIPALTDFEYYRIFEIKYFPGERYDTLYSKTKNNFFFINMDSVTGLRKITFYSFGNGRKADQLPPDKIYLDKIIIKYIALDSVPNAHYPSAFLKPNSFANLKAFAEYIKHYLDSSLNIKSVEYEPLNLKRTVDFNLKDEIYGRIWTRGYKTDAIGLELNYNLFHAMLYASERMVNEDDMAIYFQIDFLSRYDESFREKYNFPE